MPGRTRYVRGNKTEGSPKAGQGKKGEKKKNQAKRTNHSWGWIRGGGGASQRNRGQKGFHIWSQEKKLKSEGSCRGNM